jgi:chorismate-pyruvate lyase
MPSRVTRTRGEHRAVPADLLYPLSVLCHVAGVPTPLARRIRADQIPEPYRTLLDHEDSMTATLEHHFASSLDLRTLTTLKHRRGYFRRVLLVISGTGRPVAMGAARVTLAALSPRTQARILKNEIPLGRVLHTAGLDYISRPTALLAITPNQALMGAFWMPDKHTLYGRQTEMIHAGRKIGDVMEVLAPIVPHDCRHG